MSLLSKNPATLEVNATIVELTDSELTERIEHAERAYRSWRTTTFSERAQYVQQLAQYLREHKEDLARLASIEMGKTIAAGCAEVEKCAAVCEYYAEGAATMLAPEPLSPESPEDVVRFDPMGVVLAVMPWNFPFWQVYRFLAPALMAGNVALLKHASNVPLCAQAIEDSFKGAGFPEAVFQNLFVGSSRVESIIRNPHVKAVTLTGSEKAGSSVASIAGSEIKKTVLELGGSDPCIVCKDADIALAARTIAKTRMQNNVGQSCIAAKRCIVHADVHDEFVRLLKDEFDTLVVGNPLEETTTVGPLATEQGLLDIERQVATSVEKGAVVISGGARAGDKGYFYAPTILTQVTPDMPVWREETFGPVLPVVTFETEEEMIALANDTVYGLSSSLFTRDRELVARVASRIEAGSVFVNRQVASDPRVPFGGVKRSGYGRELSEYGIKEFVNVKYVSASAL
jgi:succinate-semialdehyde dehydrogenase/glutarate-semialdehyde dehydrogenase